MGEWVTDLGAWKMFGLRELEAVVETEPAAISGGRKAKSDGGSDSDPVTCLSSNCRLCILQNFIIS